MAPDRRAGGYHARVPSPSGRPPSPLDGLPRPLSERDRRRPASRRALTVGLTLGVVATIGFAAAVAWRDGTIDPVGAIAGAVAGAVSGLDPSIVDPVAVVDAGEPGLPGGSPETNLGVRPASPAPTRAPAPTARPIPTPAPPASLSGYQWPLPRGRLTLPFGASPWGSRIVDGEKFHDGIDLATFCGDRIVAAHAGTVLTAGRHYDPHMGWVGDLQPYLDRLEKKKLYPTLPIVVIIDDGNGYRSIYAHFSKVVVKKGQVVEAGEFLGLEGMTGRASGCHLHYGMFSPLETATMAIDPDVAKRMKLPAFEIARIDPLLVLPERPTPTKKPTPTPTITPPP
jgi:murein DD-endopeptidase MepM/ murein hydrolase activator NlpD